MEEETIAVSWSDSLLSESLLADVEREFLLHQLPGFAARNLGGTESHVWQGLFHGSLKLMGGGEPEFVTMRFSAIDVVGGDHVDVDIRDEEFQSRGFRQPGGVNDKLGAKRAGDFIGLENFRIFGSRRVPDIHHRGMRLEGRVGQTWPGNE